MPTGAIIGSTVVGAGVGLYGASKAAKAQKDAADKAAKTQKKMYAQSRADLAPYEQTGRSALYSLADMFGLSREGEGGVTPAFSESQLEQFRKTPDYEVARREGIDALESTAAARGGLLGGGQIKEVMRYGADLGSRYFSSYLDRLARMAGVGQSSAAGQASGALDTGTNLANLSLRGGEAEASGYVGGASAINEALGQGLQNYFTYKGLRKPSAYSGSTALS